MDDRFAIAYYVVFAVVAVASWLFWRRLSPVRKHYWQPRMSIATLVILGPFFILPPLLSGQAEATGIVTLFLVFIGYVSVAKVRVCQSCGSVAQPANLLFAGKFCAKCGAALVPSRLFGRPHE